MQGHVILVVEPGLILQQSQRISPRHAEASAACLVRIVLAGRKGWYSAIFLRLCPASMVVSVMIYAGIGLLRLLEYLLVFVRTIKLFYVLVCESHLGRL